MGLKGLVLSAFLALPVCLILSGCKKGSSPPASPYCCCSTSTGSAHWPRDGYFCSGIFSALNCSGNVYQYLPGVSSCPISKLNITLTEKSWVVEESNNKSTLPISEFKMRKDEKRIPPVCSIECSKNTKKCLKISAHNPSNTESLSELATLISNQHSEVLAKSEIMALFDIEKDPCERGDLKKRGDTLSNSGKNCAMNFELSWIGKLGVAIEIPPQLNLKFLSFGANSYEVKSSERESGFVLKLDDRFLDQDFGGHVRSIVRQNGRLTVSLPNGCISLK